MLQFSNQYLNRPQHTVTHSSIKAEATDLLPVQDYENIQYDIYCPEYDGTILEFNPTKEKQLRLICWKVKPWKQV